MTTYQNHFTHKKHRPAGDAPFSRFIDELLNTSLGDAIGNVWTANRAFVNVLESDEAFELHVAAPGLQKSDFKLEVKDGMLHISVARDPQQESSREFRSKEFDFSRFHRTFKLDERINVANIAARYENGILVVTLPKRAKETWKKQINVD